MTHTNPDIPLTPALARLAAETLDDVFTPEGDAVTIGALIGSGELMVAVVTGRLHYQERFFVDRLTASLGLLRNAREAP